MTLRKVVKNLINSKMKIEDKLKVIKDFQLKYPDAHVGGSFGLLLHGVDLKRDMSKSDIDMTISEVMPAQIEIENYVESSQPNDFDHAYRCYPNEGSEYAKVDIRITPEPSFETIVKDGIVYNVSRLRDILFRKKKYAAKGVQKHIDDLIVINGGERPEVKEPELADWELPF